MQCIELSSNAYSVLTQRTTNWKVIMLLDNWRMRSNAPHPRIHTQNAQLLLDQRKFSSGSSHSASWLRLSRVRRTALFVYQKTQIIDCGIVVCSYCRPGGSTAHTSKHTFHRTVSRSFCSREIMNSAILEQSRLERASHSQFLCILQ